MSTYHNGFFRHQWSHIAVDVQFSQPLFYQYLRLDICKAVSRNHSGQSWRRCSCPYQTRRQVSTSLRGWQNSHNKSTNTCSRPRPIDNWFRFVSCFTNAHTHTHTHTCSCGVSVSTQVHQYQLVLLDRAHLQNISAKMGKYIYIYIYIYI